MDANHRELFYELLLNNYEEHPRTIVIATHLIEEVANLIEEVVLIDHGRILLEDSVNICLRPDIVYPAFRRMWRNSAGTEK